MSAIEGGIFVASMLAGCAVAAFHIDVQTKTMAVKPPCITFHLVAKPVDGVPAGYRAYRCRVPGYVIRGFLKSVTKSDDGSEVLEPDGEYTSTPDPSKRLKSLIYIREDAVIPAEFLGPPERR